MVVPLAGAGAWRLPHVPSRRPLADRENLRRWTLWRGPAPPREGCDGPEGPLASCFPFFFSFSSPPPQSLQLGVARGEAAGAGWITLDVRVLNNGAEPGVFVVFFFFGWVPPYYCGNPEK